MLYLKGNQRLSIINDEYADSPREWSNLGYFITCESDTESPDSNPAIQGIIKSTGDEATDQDDHIKLITQEIKEQLGEIVLTIWPVVKYEHNAVSYKLGTVHGFDYSNNGFYIITNRSIKETGAEKKDWQKIVENELKIYNQWFNGEVYYYELCERGEFKPCPTCGHNPIAEWKEIDRSGSYYSIEEIFGMIGSKQADWEEIEE